MHAHDDHRLAMAFAIAGLTARRTGHHRRRGRGGRVVPRLLRRSRAAARVKADKVYLVGFMGAGKSTVARALARRLDWKAEDIDERIEQRERRDIPTIFRQDGEPYLPRRRTAGADCAPPRARHRRRDRRRHVRRTGGPRADAARRRGASGWTRRLPRSSTACPGWAPSARSRPASRWKDFIISGSWLTAKRTSGSTRVAGSVEELVDQIVEWLGGVPACAISSSATSTPTGGLDTVLAAAKPSATTGCSCSAISWATGRIPNAVVDEVRDLGPARADSRQSRQGRLGRRKPRGLQRRRAQRHPLDLRCADGREPRAGSRRCPPGR